MNSASANNYMHDSQHGASYNYIDFTWVHYVERYSGESGMWKENRCDQIGANVERDGCYLLP